MSLISVSHLTFAYEGSYDNIFTDASFCLDTDWRLGFCGRNGRGKTTLLKLLMGRHEYSGTITASVSFDYFPYLVANPMQNTLDILTTIVPDAPLWKIQRELSLLSVIDDALYRPFATLSNGEQTKALLAGLFLRENSFHLIDEPTNHLDMAGREMAARYLYGKSGFILVSHDRAFLDECVDHILSINRANIEIQSGNFSSWQRNKRMQDEYEMAENERLKKDISRLKAVARQTAEWSDKVEKSKNQPLKSGLSADRGYIGHKAAKMMKRSMSAEKRQQEAVRNKSKLLHNVENSEPLKLHPLQYHASRLLSIENLSIAYGGDTVFRDMSFTLEQGERVALVGGNGCGKSSLLKLICGESAPHNTPYNSIPQRTAPQRTAPQSGAPQRTAPQSGVPQSTAPHDIPYNSTQHSGSLHSIPDSSAPCSIIPYSGAPHDIPYDIGDPYNGAPYTAPQSGAPYNDAPQSTTPQSGALHSDAPRSGVPHRTPHSLSHSGAVTVGSRLIVSYVPQDASFLAGALDEYARWQGIDGTLFKTILRKLDFSRVQFEKDMRDYSAGQKKKVLLARSLCEQAHLYVWDEPLNYIDILSRIQIEELILAYLPTLLFVEHDRAFCENIATKTMRFTK